MRIVCRASALPPSPFTVHLPSELRSPCSSQETTNQWPRLPPAILHCHASHVNQPAPSTPPRIPFRTCFLCARQGSPAAASAQKLMPVPPPCRMYPRHVSLPLPASFFQCSPASQAGPLLRYYGVSAQRAPPACQERPHFPTQTATPPEGYYFFLELSIYMRFMQQLNKQANATGCWRCGWCRRRSSSSGTGHIRSVHHESWYPICGEYAAHARAQQRMRSCCSIAGTGHRQRQRQWHWQLSGALERDKAAVNQ